MGGARDEARVEVDGVVGAKVGDHEERESEVVDHKEGGRGMWAVAGIAEFFFCGGAWWLTSRWSLGAAGGHTANLGCEDPACEAQKAEDDEGKRVGDVEVGFSTEISPGRGAHIAGGWERSGS